MAKVVGKKAAAAARRQSAKKQAARPGTKATKKPAAKVKAAAKPAAKAKPVAKKPVKPPKPASRPAAKAKTAAPAPKPAPKPAAKPAPKVAPPPARPVLAKPVAAPPPAPKPVPAAVEKKRTRRPRPKLTSSGPPTAAWFVKGDKPRSSSFIPAPARAEAPSLVAAPPASSDRLVSAHELTEFAVRTVPVRIDVESGGGRIFLSINPSEVTLKIGEGIEWDFRYVGGADVIVDELAIEFEKPAPFPQTAFRSRRPGAARPHRQLSGPAQKSAAGKRVQYVVRAINAFRTELATARPFVNVVS